MKRQAPDDFNASAPKHSRPSDPLLEFRIARLRYDPRTTPQNNPLYDPSMDRYLGLHQPNPDYDDSFDQYLGR